MHVLHNNVWQPGFLDFHMGRGDYRIVVRWYGTLLPLDDMYFVPSRDVRRVWNYIREIGMRHVWRKIRSRRSERFRNNKFLAVGIGRILERDNNASLPLGQPVLFLAPAHPRCLERIVLPPLLVKPVSEEFLTRLTSPDPQTTWFCEIEDWLKVLAPEKDWLEKVAGWNRFSGEELKTYEIEPIFKRIEELLIQYDPSQNRPLIGTSPVQESQEKIGPPQKKGKDWTRSNNLQAVLFGYGQYAKTVILPNLLHIDIMRVHEVDPLQLGLTKDLPFACDSSPDPRENQKFDVYCIAGFHHTHAPLAIHAVQNGASAIVEKPLVTTQAQLDQLLESVSVSKGRIFAGFHKRYTPFNDLARRDLGVKKGDPISYHCIVYEVKLPALHWYRWPNSGSRIISNGCHWIDHFLFLNDFSPVCYYDVRENANEDVICLLELENGASFSMVLTDHGSSRIGVQDYIELRARQATVVIQNSSIYHAEDSRRVIRRIRVNKMTVYAQMYRKISEKIVNGDPGDSLRSLEASARAMLNIEMLLSAKKSNI